MQNDEVNDAVNGWLTCIILSDFDHCCLSMAVAVVTAGVVRQRTADLWVPHEDSEQNNGEQLKPDGKQRETHRLQHVAAAAAYL